MGGRVLADLTRHRVRVPGHRLPTSVIVARLTPTDGPLQTIVLANAVTAFTTLVRSWA